MYLCILFAFCNLERKFLSSHPSETHGLILKKGRNLSPEFFWVTTQRVLVIPYWRLATFFRSHLQRSMVDS
jgi:hypothetical protein